MENITNTIKLFEYYKSLGENAIDQISDEALLWAPDVKSNSIHVIIKHLHGNMLSRWTDFLTTDGEKNWRNRDGEFEETNETREQILLEWNEGWDCVFNALNQLTPDDLSKIVYIRNIGQSADEAIMHQLTHYAYHVGQIVYLARLANEGDWKSLTIPKGESVSFNQEKFGLEKREEHFTDLLK
ncbi:MAG: DinB family protein [Saprospiraceae bacterium]